MRAKAVILVVVAGCPLVANSAFAQSATKDLSRVSGREYVHLCGSPEKENDHPCLRVVYASATVNRLLDVLYKQKTFCPPTAPDFPPSGIVSSASDWLRRHPALLDKPSPEGLSEALKQMYPCR